MSENSTIQERILQFLDYKGITKYKFYQITGIANGFLDKRGSIGSDKCEQIISHFKDIHPEWLLTGKGEMLKGYAVSASKLVEEDSVEYKDNLKAKEIEKRLYDCFMVNQDLQNEVRELKAKLEKMSVGRDQGI